MRNLLAGALLVSTAGLSASAAPLVYDPFDYSSGQGLSQGDGAGGWLFDPNPATNPGPEPQVVSGNLTSPNPGLPPSQGNSIALDGTGGSSTVLPLPGRPYGESTTLYYSLIFKVNDVAGAGGGGGSYLAGFHDDGFTRDEDGNPVGGALTGAGNAGAPILIRAANAESTAYELGTGVTAATANRRWFATDFDADDVLLLVLSYTNNNNADDVARMWINPDPDLDEASNAAALAIEHIEGTNEIVGNQIASFFFRNNGVEPDVIQIDELRIATNWNDVMAIPEPTGLALLSLGGLALAKRRRH